MDIFLIGASALTGLGYMSKGTMSMAVKKDISDTALSLATDKYGESIDQAKAALSKVQKKLDHFHSMEKAEINNRLDLSDEYRVADTNAKAAKAKIDILKKAVKAAGEDSAKVAVGSGDSAVAVSISNTSAKTKLQADLAEAEALHKTNVDICNAIKSKVTASVTADRGAEYFEVKESVDAAREELNRIVSESNAYSNEIANKADVKMKAIKSNYSESMIFGSAVLKSALPAYALYKIWKTAAEDIQTLRTAKELI